MDEGELVVLNQVTINTLEQDWLKEQEEVEGLVANPITATFSQAA